MNGNVYFEQIPSHLYSDIRGIFNARMDSESKGGTYLFTYNISEKKKQVSWAVSDFYINSLSPSSDTGMQYTQNYYQLDS